MESPRTMSTLETQGDDSEDFPITNKYHGRRDGIQIDRDSKQYMKEVTNLENRKPNTDPLNLNEAIRAKRQIGVYAKFLARGRIRDSFKHEYFLGNIGESEKLRHGMGQISKRLYDGIEGGRRFDRYFRPVSTKKSSRVAALNNLKKSLQSDPISTQKDGINETENDAVPAKTARLSSNYLSTAPPDRQRRPTVLGPVGTDNTSYAVVFKSDGNETFYNYDGMWDHGKPNGRGRYCFADGMDFLGCWQNGKQSGPGVSRYPTGCTYMGKWKDGCFHGYGKIIYMSGARYEGTWRKGKRHGIGEMVFPTGTIYRGHWKFGKPYGFGEMISISSGIKFKGTWRRGYINGMGTLHLNDKEYIARDWSRERGRTFKELIDDIIEERRVKKDNKIQAHKAHYGNTELNLIRFYVKNVRHKIYQDRKKARDKKNRDAQKFKAQMREKRRKMQLESLQLMATAPEV